MASKTRTAKPSPPTGASGTVKLRTSARIKSTPKPDAAGKPDSAAKNADMLKKPEFIERTMTRTSVKKRDAKPAIEAALATLAEALKAGEDVHLPPLGKIKVIKSKTLDGGVQVIALKLRTMRADFGKPKTATPEDLADAKEAV